MLESLYQTAQISSSFGFTVRSPDTSNQTELNCNFRDDRDIVVLDNSTGARPKTVKLLPCTAENGNQQVSPIANESETKDMNFAALKEKFWPYNTDEKKEHCIRQESVYPLSGRQDHSLIHDVAKQSNIMPQGMMPNFSATVDQCSPGQVPIPSSQGINVQHNASPSVILPAIASNLLPPEFSSSPPLVMPSAVSCLLPVDNAGLLPQILPELVLPNAISVVSNVDDKNRPFPDKWLPSSSCLLSTDLYLRYLHRYYMHRMIKEAVQCKPSSMLKAPPPGLQLPPMAASVGASLFSAGAVPLPHVDSENSHLLETTDTNITDMKLRSEHETCSSCGVSYSATVPLRAESFDERSPTETGSMLQHSVSDSSEDKHVCAGEEDIQKARVQTGAFDFPADSIAATVDNPNVISSDDDVQQTVNCTRNLTDSDKLEKLENALKIRKDSTDANCKPISEQKYRKRDCSVLDCWRWPNCRFGNRCWFHHPSTSEKHEGNAKAAYVYTWHAKSAEAKDALGESDKRLCHKKDSLLRISLKGDTVGQNAGSSRKSVRDDAKFSGNLEVHDKYKRSKFADREKEGRHFVESKFERDNRKRSAAKLPASDLCTNSGFTNNGSRNQRREQKDICSRNPSHTGRANGRPYKLMEGAISSISSDSRRDDYDDACRSERRVKGQYEQSRPRRRHRRRFDKKKPLQEEPEPKIRVGKFCEVPPRMQRTAAED